MPGFGSCRISCEMFPAGPASCGALLPRPAVRATPFILIEGQRRMVQSSAASRVLVIDDEAAVRASVCGILSDVGYIVAEAGDGVAGVDSLRSSAADAVVMDIYMPQQDGFETIRELRRV